MDATFEKLLSSSPVFKRLHREHQRCEQKLQKMNSIKKLTAVDEVERKKIQKLKLQKKDEMQRMLLSSASKRRKAN